MKLSKGVIDTFKNAVKLGDHFSSKLVTDLLGHIEVVEQQYSELKQENLQRLEEVKGLQRKVESLTEFGNKASAHLRKVREDLSKAWAAHNAEREARVLMEVTLERAMLDHQPVELPKEVAGAIETLINEKFAPLEIIQALLPYPFGRASHIEKAVDQINNFLDVDDDTWDPEKGELLMKAIVNGYTVEVEQTVEDKLLDYFNGVTPKDWKFTGDGNDPVYLQRSAIRTTCSILDKEIEGINSK